MNATDEEEDLSLFKNKEWEDMSFEERLTIKIRSEKSFLNFTRIWFELIQGERLRVNWHHRYAAMQVDEIVRGSECSQSVAICFPPGGTKSEFMSIHLPAYTNMLVSCGVLKKFRNMNLSFADSLVKRNSRRTKDIIASTEYQELWPCSFGVNKSEEWAIVDEKGKVKGETVSRAMGGQITGGRGGYMGTGYSGSVNLDDPAKPEDMFSSVKRNALNRKMNNTVRSRRGDKSKYNSTPFILTMQRLHKEDPVGFCLNGEMGVSFKLVKVPALITLEFLNSLPTDVAADCWECIKDSECVIKGGVKYWSYWPEAEDIGQLMDLWERDEYTFMSQYMQDPISHSGGLIDTDWFPRFEVLPPNIIGGAVYVDTNSGKIKDKNDYTVFLLALEDNNGNIYVPYVKRGKWDPEQLLAQAESFWKECNDSVPHTMGFKMRYMSVEDKQAGQGLIQTLSTKKRIPLHAQQRGSEQNKYARHCNTQPTMKLGKVFLPQMHIPEGLPGEGNAISHTKWTNGDIAFSNNFMLPFLGELSLITLGILMDQESGFDDQYDCLMDAVDDMLLSGSSLSAVMAARRAAKAKRR